MKNYIVLFATYRKFEKPKLSCVFEKILVLSNVFSNSKMKRKNTKDIEDYWFN